MRPPFWLAALLLLTVAAYIPGLNGPFLFDDPPNLILPFNAWLNGQTGWQEIVLGNGSGIFGRPLSMLSFLANVSFSGLEPLPFKLTNLVIHLLCGALVYLLLSRLLTRDPQFGASAQRAALIISALWLLHPMQVSTVLYVVQRMAQLSALFMLAALLAYVLGRLALEQGRRNSALAWLFLALPIATLAAIFSKENGALVPLLCAVIELGYFSARDQARRPRTVQLFFGLSLLLPAAVAFGWYMAHPQQLLGGYEGRLFSLGERLLSEPRALMEYMAALLLPRGPALGVYTDDFTVSHGLLDPPTTLFAILGLLALATAAWRLRRRMPAFFTGIGLFLAAHVMESTVFPLELYFEHRNYLPSVGFFLAVGALGCWLFTWALPHTDDEVRARRWAIFGVTALIVMLSIATMARASMWSSWQAIAAQGVRQHPQSMRAHLDYANLLQQQGRHAEVLQVFEYMTTMQNPAARHAGIIDIVTFQCMTAGATDAKSVNRIRTIVGVKLQLAEMLAFENLGNYLQKRDCAQLNKSELASIIVDAVDTAPQPARLTQLWRNRFIAAQLYASDGRLALARQQAALAWMTGAADNAVGVFLAHLYFASGDVPSARLVLDDVRERLASWDRRSNKLVDELQIKIADASTN